MQSTRWITVLGTILMGNTCLILVASIWSLATAGENPPAQQGSDNQVADDIEVNSVPANEQAEADDVDRQGHSKSSQDEQVLDEAAPVAATPTDDDRLSAIELPELPTIDAREMERDPVFQEFQKLLGAERTREESLQTLNPQLEFATSPDAASANAPLQSADDFAAAEARLKTTSLVVESARSLTAEAAALARRNHQQQAARLMQVAHQLRRVAAELLTAP